MSSHNQGKTNNNDEDSVAGTSGSTENQMREGHKPPTDGQSTESNVTSDKKTSASDVQSSSKMYTVSKSTRSSGASSGQPAPGQSSNVLTTNNLKINDKPRRRDKEASTSASGKAARDSSTTGPSPLTKGSVVVSATTVTEASHSSKPANPSSDSQKPASGEGSVGNEQDNKVSPSNVLSTRPSPAHHQFVSRVRPTASLSLVGTHSSSDQDSRRGLSSENGFHGSNKSSAWGSNQLTSDRSLQTIRGTDTSELRSHPTSHMQTSTSDNTHSTGARAAFATTSMSSDVPGNDKVESSSLTALKLPLGAHLDNRSQFHERYTADPTKKRRTPPNSSETGNSSKSTATTNKLQDATLPCFSDGPGPVSAGGMDLLTVWPDATPSNQPPNADAQNESIDDPSPLMQDNRLHVPSPSYIDAFPSNSGKELGTVLDPHAGDFYRHEPVAPAPDTIVSYGMPPLSTSKPSATSAPRRTSANSSGRIPASTRSQLMELQAVLNQVLTGKGVYRKRTSSKKDKDALEEDVINDLVSLLQNQLAADANSPASSVTNSNASTPMEMLIRSLNQPSPAGSTSANLPYSLLMSSKLSELTQSLADDNQESNVAADKQESKEGKKSTEQRDRANESSGFLADGNVTTSTNTGVDKSARSKVATGGAKLMHKTLKQLVNQEPTAAGPNRGLPSITLAKNTSAASRRKLPKDPRSESASSLFNKVETESKDSGFRRIKGSSCGYYQKVLFSRVVNKREGRQKNRRAGVATTSSGTNRVGTGTDRSLDNNSQYSNPDSPKSFEGELGDSENSVKASSTMATLSQIETPATSQSTGSGIRSSIPGSSHSTGSGYKSSLLCSSQSRSMDERQVSRRIREYIAPRRLADTSLPVINVDALQQHVSSAIANQHSNLSGANGARNGSPLPPPATLPRSLTLNSPYRSPNETPNPRDARRLLAAFQASQRKIQHQQYSGGHRLRTPPGQALEPTDSSTSSDVTVANNATARHNQTATLEKLDDVINMLHNQQRSQRQGQSPLEAPGSSLDINALANSLRQIISDSKNTESDHSANSGPERPPLPPPKRQVQAAATPRSANNDAESPISAVSQDTSAAAATLSSAVASTVPAATRQPIHAVTFNGPLTDASTVVLDNSSSASTTSSHHLIRHINYPSTGSHTSTSQGSLSHQQAEIGQLQEQFVVLQRTFKDLTGQCSRVLDTLAYERQRIHERECAIKAKVKDQGKASRTKRINLNIGGTKFTFSERALDNFPGSYLDIVANGIEGRDLGIERDEDGYLFIDRDPTAFRDILHYLRGGDLNALRSRTTSDLKILSEEARFYGIDLLLMELNCVRYHWYCESDYGHPTLFGTSSVTTTTTLRAGRDLETNTSSDRNTTSSNGTQPSNPRPPNAIALTGSLANRDSSSVSTVSSGDPNSGSSIRQPLRGMKICTGIKFTARCFATAVLVNDTTAYVFGGCTWNEVFFNDLTKVTISPISEDEYRRYMMTTFGTGAFEYIEGQSAYQARDGSQHHRPGQLGVPIRNVAEGALPPGALLQPYRPERYHFELAPNKSAVNTSATASVSLSTHTRERIPSLGSTSGGGGGSTSGDSNSSRFAPSTAISYEGTEISEPSPRSGHSMVHLKSHIVVFYGNAHNEHVPSVEAYNLITCVWQRLRIMGDPVIPRSGHTTTVINVNTNNPTVLLLGGKQFFPSIRKLPEMYIGDFNFARGTVTWKKAEVNALTPAAYFYPNYESSGFARNSSRTGGSSDNEPLASNTNGRPSSMPPSVSVTANSISGASLRSSDVASASSMQQIANKLLQRSYHTAVCYKDRYVYIFGGISDDNYSNDLLELDISTFILKLIKGDPLLAHLTGDEILDRALQGDLNADFAPAGYIAPVARSGHVAALHGDSMYIIGSYGTDDGDNIVKMHQFKIPTQTWTVVNTSGRAPAQRAAPAVVMFPGNAAHGVLPKVTVIGGYSVEQNNCYNDVLSMYV